MSSILLCIYTKYTEYCDRIPYYDHLKLMISSCDALGLHIIIIPSVFYSETHARDTNTESISHNDDVRMSVVH